MEKGHFFLDENQTKAMLDLAEIRRNDVFCDIGSGDGIAVRMAVSYTHAKQAIGVEIAYENYQMALKNAIDNLSKSQLKKVEFWFGRWDSEDTDDGKFIFDYSRATVVYNSLTEDELDIDFYKERFSRKRVRLLTKDVPLVGYRPVARSDKIDDCWFFLMRLSRLTRDRIGSKTKWAESVMGRQDVTIDDVYTFYRKQLSTRDTIPKHINQAICDLKRLVCYRF